MTDREVRRNNRSLSGKIFKLVSIFTLTMLLLFAGAITVIYYLSYERNAEDALVAQTQDAARELNENPSSDHVSLLQKQFAGETRYTLIAADGSVSYDSHGDADTLDNHADRPEVQEALASKQATTMRYSDTLRTDTVYAAVGLADGGVIRLAETRHSLITFFEDLALPMLISLGIAMVLVFFLSRLLTRHIMKPIDALDFAEPLENDIYEEMEPLLKRFNEQQDQLKKQNLELAQAENLRRDFSSNVSHEMKTPLQVISGYAELMRNDMMAPEDRQKAVDLIYDEAQTMRSLINDVLTLSRLDEAAIENDAQSLDLYVLAQRVKQRLDSFAADHGVSVDIEGESSCIAGNSTLAQEMLYNLLENGIRYNHPGGRVVMTVRNDAEEVKIEVTDSGPGMPDDMTEKIFERFFRIDKSRSKETGGTGLGLAIVKHAVLYHQGNIEVETKLGEGTRFTLRFPRY